MFDKPSPFENVHTPKFSLIIATPLFLGLEMAMGTTLFAVYNQTIGLMNEAYLSELPLIGEIFRQIDPDANAGHLISFLLSIFSVGTPLFLWSEIFRQKILENPREWISHPQNQIIAGFAALVLLLVFTLETVNLFTLIAKETSPLGGVYVKEQSKELMSFLAENKGMAIAVSIVIAVINIILALFTTRTLRALKSSQEV